MHRQVILSLLAVGFMLAVTTRGPAQERPGATFTTIDVPEAIDTEAVDINANGEIVGRYYDQFGRPSCKIPCFIIDGHNHGYLLSRDGSFTTIDVPFPGSRLTAALGINPQGDIVGRYVTCQQGTECRVADSISHGFLRRGDTFTSIDFSATFTIATGINPRGDIVGAFDDARGRHAFLLKDDGQFMPFDFPDAGAVRTVSTEAWKINPAGDIVGQYESIDPLGNRKPHVFLRSSEGEFTSIDFPGPSGPFSTAPFPATLVGINARGDIVSTYCESLLPEPRPRCPLIPGNLHGFLLSKGEFTSIDVPATVGDLTVAWGINARGDIVGSYGFLTTCCDINNKGHGYLLSRGK